MSTSPSTQARRPETIAKALHYAATTWPEQTAITDPDRSITFAELKQEAESFADGLAARGVRPGDHLAIWMVNSVDWVVVDLATALMGVALVPVNVQFGPDEMSYIIQQSRSSALIMDTQVGPHNSQDVLASIRAKLDDLRTVVVRGTDTPLGDASAWTDVMSGGTGPRPPYAASQDDIAYILYTSGTTSFPKGVLLRHRNVLHTAYEVGERLGWKAGEKNLAGPPLFSSFGAITNVLGALVHGVATLTMPRFSPKTALRMIAAEGATTFIGVDTMLRDMVDLVKSGTEEAPTSLWTAIAIPMNQVLAADVRSVLGVSVVHSGYGLTEGSACSAFAALVEDGSNVNVLEPLPGVRLRIVDPVTLEDCPPDTTGELWINGPAVMLGYFDKPIETAETLVEDDGDVWLRSGDLASRDAQGAVRFEGRLKDIVKTGGFNVSALEVERVLKDYPGVVDAAFVGVPDDRLTEIGIAFVKVSDDRVTPESLVAHAREHLARFKVPRDIRVVPEFPATSTGKIQKGRLRSGYLAQKEEAQA